MITQNIKKLLLKASILASKNKWLAVIYYLFNYKGFSDEQHCVLSGIVKNKTDIINIGNFRRAIHRIEKGLITQPFKLVFAENYILNTVSVYKTLLNSDIDKPTLTWATGILIQYFETVKLTEIISKAKAEFYKIGPLMNNNLPHTFSAISRKKTNISLDDFYELNLQRRSIRYYINQQVPRNQIEKAIQIALQSPSACNRQPFTYRIIDDPDLVKKAAKLPLGSTTFSENIPMMIFIIGDLSNYFDERDKHLIYIDGSLSAMTFILSLELLGLSSCIINWSDIPENNKKIKNLLNLKKWEQCIMAISVGFAQPEGGIPSSIKKDLKYIIKYN